MAAATMNRWQDNLISGIAPCDADAFTAKLQTAEERKMEQSQQLRDYKSLRRIYLSNRVFQDNHPHVAYEHAVEDWALMSRSNRAMHCETLLKAVSNPMMLEPALNHLLERAKLTEYERWCYVDNNVEQRWKGLRDVKESIIKKTFRPGKYRTYKIAKPGKQGTRTIEVPGLETRTVAETLHFVLSPLFDPYFYDLSIGFRPQRSPLHGIAAASQLQRLGLRHWVRCDIKDAFGNIPKSTALEILSSGLHGSSVMWLVEQLLVKDRKRGIPQGLSISPLVMNVYLDRILDKWWVKNARGTCLVRYADDLLIGCPNQQSATDAYQTLRQRLGDAGMPIKESQQEAIFNLAAGAPVDWLGFQLRLNNEKLACTISEQSRERFEWKLAETRRVEANLEEAPLEDFNPIGLGRIWAKAIGIKRQELSLVAKRMRQMGKQYGFDVSKFTDEKVTASWKAGFQQFKLARGQTKEWVSKHAPQSTQDAE